MVKVQAERASTGWLCHVTVEHGRARTEHSVAVAPADLERWAHGTAQEDVEDLVARSFAFLLEREPAESIMRSFDISVIHRYFPEYNQAFGPKTR